MGFLRARLEAMLALRACPSTVSCTAPSCESFFFFNPIWEKREGHQPGNGFTPPLPLEDELSMDTLTPSPAPVVYKMPGPLGGGFLYTTGAEAENSAVNS